ncbi:uncharacterized protein LOC115560828 isoform X3 [Gadus morhua]|uniref:uncharacterized protein LOC115560828 isoform X3 n=1 Tax=Gadus morhua TaxID=8049 RepID=UPI0011B6979F|nr:uncharacterized protein LOC115560828 isoform X3 [Gadus morhua]
MWYSQATRRQLFKLDLTFKMFDMHKSIAWFALCNLCASLNDQSHCQDSCDTVMISASLRSSILLPCHAPFLGLTDWMLWVQNTGAPLVNLSSQGKVWFLEPREGRVKTFPNEGSRGNYTIRIDGLQESDLGCYQCGPADACHQVVVQKEEVDLWLPLCITAGVTTVILFVCFCCYKASFSGCKGCSLSQRGTRKRQENDEQEPADIGLSEDERLARNQDQGPPETIHDYEEQSESVAPCRPVRGHPQLERTRSTERKHALLNREIFSRLRQASRHFYVNQDEIIQQRSSAQKERRPRGLRGKKAKQRYENPIYNSSPSQVNHL